MPPEESVEAPKDVLSADFAVESSRTSHERFTDADKYQYFIYNVESASLLGVPVEFRDPGGLRAAGSVSADPRRSERRQEEHLRTGRGGAGSWTRE